MSAMNDGESGRADAPRVTRESLHLPFRPKRARLMSRAIATVELLVVGIPALFVAESGPGKFGWGDRLAILALAVVIAAVIFRFSMLSAIPDENGLVVHNVLFTKRLEWAQIVSVRFGGGNPWVLLDLDDGESMAVMAIQRADGPRGEAEAGRLATLVALHSQTPRDT